MKLQRVRVLRPFAHAGRVYGVAERLVLESMLADELREAGYVAPVADAALLVADGAWGSPVTR